METSVRMGPEPGRSLRRAVVLVLWALAIGVGLVLTVQRYREALEGATGDDLRVFVQAAADARAGRSPYDSATYVYSPFVAWILTPLPSLAAAVGVWAAVSLAACWATVAAVTATFWRMLAGWRRPVFAGLALSALLFNHAMETELWLGQVDTLVLLLTASTVLLSSLRLPVATGAAIALDAIVKSWPGASVLWLLRRGAPHRWRGLGAFAVGLVVFAGVVGIVGGPQQLAEWAARTTSSTQQPLLAYSVWGLGRFLFSHNGVMPPVLDAPIAGAVLSWTLAAVVLVLVVITLRRPGSASLSMWNLMAAIVLLLPVSHLAYRILLVPLVVTWVAHVLRSPRPRTIVAAVAMAVVWTVTFRTPVLDARHSDDRLVFAAIVLVAIVGLAASVLIAASGDRAGLYAEPALRSRPVTDMSTRRVDPV